MNQLNLNAFDIKTGEALKDAGMETAAEARAKVLALGREFCRITAVQRDDRTATADDAYTGLIASGYSGNCLGNSAGSLFRGHRWVFTGRWVKSKRVSNHARMIRVWRLELP